MWFSLNYQILSFFKCFFNVSCSCFNSMAGSFNGYLLSGFIAFVKVKMWRCAY